MENWDASDWLALGLGLGIGLLILFFVFVAWQSPHSRLGMGLALLWRRLRGRS